MQEMNLIHLSKPDFTAISRSVMLSTQISRNIVSVVVAHESNSVVPFFGAAKISPHEESEKVGSDAELLRAGQSGRGIWGDLVVRQHSKGANA